MCKCELDGEGTVVEETQDRAVWRQRVRKTWIPDRNEKRRIGRNTG